MNQQVPWYKNCTNSIQTWKIMNWSQTVMPSKRLVLNGKTLTPQTAKKSYFIYRCTHYIWYVLACYGCLFSFLLWMEVLYQFIIGRCIHKLFQYYSKVVLISYAIWSSRNWNKLYLICIGIEKNIVQEYHCNYLGKVLDKAYIDGSWAVSVSTVF